MASSTSQADEILVTRQICSLGLLPPPKSQCGVPLAEDVAELSVQDASGKGIPFGELFRERRAIVVFVRHFLCYTCKEYVEDLAKIPKSFLQDANVTLIVIGQSSFQHIEPFCKLTRYSHEIYVDTERKIYRKLGMNKGEGIASSEQSPHVKSNLLSGSIQSLWRAVTGPAFDFQGDPAQQGGTLILGPAGEKRKAKKISSETSMRLNKLWYLLVMEYYCAKRNNKVEEFHGDWNNLQEVMQSERSRTRKTLYTETDTLWYNRT
uniref:Peroxiredoxin like 2C n=1 Tax=Monodelphis domestica TaxID=13616 RepID=A0A5F8H852_MONDO